jgi:hypothetical protein
MNTFSDDELRRMVDKEFQVEQDAKIRKRMRRERRKNAKLAKKLRANTVQKRLNQRKAFGNTSKPKTKQGGGCAVTAIGVAGAVAALAATWKGWT